MPNTILEVDDGLIAHSWKKSRIIVFTSDGDYDDTVIEHNVKIAMTWLDENVSTGFLNALYKAMKKNYDY